MKGGQDLGEALGGTLVEWTALRRRPLDPTDDAPRPPEELGGLACHHRQRHIDGDPIGDHGEPPLLVHQQLDRPFPPREAYRVIRSQAEGDVVPPFVRKRDRFPGEPRALRGDQGADEGRVDVDLGGRMGVIHVSRGGGGEMLEVEGLR